MHLKKIDLGANRIRFMDEEELSGLVNLEELWLGKNKIEEIQGLDKVCFESCDGILDKWFLTLSFLAYEAAQTGCAIQSSDASYQPVHTGGYAGGTLSSAQWHQRRRCSTANRPCLEVYLLEHTRPESQLPHNN
jgi:hypothetical protein